MKNPNHDFTPAIEATTISIAKQIIGALNQEPEKYIVKLGEKTDAERLQENIDFSKFVIEVTKMIASTDIPLDYASYGVERIIATLTMVKNQIEGVVRTTEDQVLSGFYGVRNPKNGALARDCVTFAQAFDALNKMNEEKGYTQADYDPNAERPQDEPETEGAAVAEALKSEDETV